MSNLLIWIATLITVVAVVTGLARWVSKRSRSLRNVVTFVMAAGSSYCASFVVDMWAQAALGNIPPANVIMPSVTWLLFAFVLAGGAFTARGSAYAIGLHLCLMPCWHWPSAASTFKTSPSGSFSSYWRSSQFYYGDEWSLHAPAARRSR